MRLHCPRLRCRLERRRKQLRRHDKELFAADLVLSQPAGLVSAVEGGLVDSTTVTGRSDVAFLRPIQRWRLRGGLSGRRAGGEQPGARPRRGAVAASGRRPTGWQPSSTRSPAARVERGRPARHHGPRRRAASSGRQRARRRRQLRLSGPPDHRRAPGRPAGTGELAPTPRTRS
jgi:hypothetical protein